MFSKGINIVISSNCAVIIKTSGLKSILPAEGINFLNPTKIKDLRPGEYLIKIISLDQADQSIQFIKK